MIRRILFGLLWCFIFYIGAAGITGGIAGAKAGGKDPAHAAEAGAAAGAKAVEGLAGYFFAGAVVLSAAGTVAGILPGTHAKKRAKMFDELDR